MNNTYKSWELIKKKHPDAIILVRSGDIFKTYNGDAERVSDVFGTQIQYDKTRYTSFPSQELDLLLPRLVRAGYRVCLCDTISER